MNQPDNAHLEDMVNEGTAELAEISVSHVIGDSNDTHEWLPSNRKRRRGRGRGIVVGEETHEAAGLLDSRVSGGEIEERGREWRRR